VRYADQPESAQIEEMAVEGALTGNPRLIYQAIAHDPLTAAMLSLAEIRQMVNQMFEQNQALPAAVQAFHA
jgi:alpha-galactosidase